MSSFTLLLLFGVLSLVFWRASTAISRRRRATEAKHRGCEDPPTLPRKGFLGLGRLSEVSKANKEGRTPQWFIEKFEEVGQDVHTFRASALDYELIVTRDPENARAIFQTNAREFEISPHRKDIWSPLLGDGIFTAQGEAWKHSRQLLRPQFAREQISDLDVEEEHVQSLLNLSLLRSDKDGWTRAVDLAPLFLNLTMDVATEFLYGRSVNSQTQTPVESIGDSKRNDTNFSYHLEAGKSWLYTKGLFGRWNRFIHSTKFTDHCREVHRFVDELVTCRLNKPSVSKLESEIESSKPQRFFLLDELAKYTQNPLELRNETLQILNAGRDTTGSLLGWVFYYLARNPHAFSKLRSIILEEFGSNRTGEISFQKLKNCEYLNHVIQEVLRVAAVVPVNERFATSDTVLPYGGGPDGSSPIFIPKGMRILIANYAMQHREDIWGADVQDFKPERWEKRRGEGGHQGWEFLPFGAGRRKCIGQQFALTETSYVVIRFLQRFDRLESVDSEEVFFQYIFSNRSGKGVRVKMHEAAVGA
ncbi:related to n-alkane-inducible cytochrome P450 [Phialocephala subalpina]|uniref:Related to n-alkane-inducible cytochrome P450 n=1 Tax=Phialocephala subalpina TaxID=576137 RepID=A0A1L7WP43_9HELO|nr:related to n-alkane-inducible cytochrome P450 [Phialocephala subalpina]